MFALIASGQVAEIAPSKFPVHPSMSWVDISAVSPAPQPGWAYASGVFTAPVAPPSPSVPILASAALAESDVTVIRCYEHAVAVPAEWVAYRAALRAIVSSGTGSLPTRPAFPAGT